MIAQLKAMIGMDTRQYVAGSRQIQNSTQRMRQSFQAIGRAIGISFSVAAIVQGARAIMRWSSEVSIAARNAGILTSEMIALNRVAQQTGLGVNNMQQLLVVLHDRVMDAAEGNREAQEAFERMGLSVDDLLRMDPAQMFEEVARAATQTGVPLSNLIDLFGRRLGPNARAALEDIAKNGMPSVDRSIGETADRLEALGSHWARTMDDMKQWTLGVASAVGQWHQRLTDTLGTMIAMRGAGGREAWKASAQRQEERLSQIRIERDERRELEKTERVARRKQTLEKQLQVLQEEQEKRMMQTERIRGTAPTLSSMEQMGAGFGGDRTIALQAADKQLQVAREQLRVQQEFSERIQDIKDRLDNITREM